MSSSVKKINKQKGKSAQNGKGSMKRPMFISREQYEKNWDRIFSKKK